MKVRLVIEAARGIADNVAEEVCQLEFSHPLRPEADHPARGSIPKKRQ
jgi:hypothetical protein